MLSSACAMRSSAADAQVVPLPAAQRQLMHGSSVTAELAQEGDHGSLGPSWQHHHLCSRCCDIILCLHRQSMGELALSGLCRRYGRVQWMEAGPIQSRIPRYAYNAISAMVPPLLSIHKYPCLAFTPCWLQCRTWACRCTCLPEHCQHVPCSVRMHGEVFSSCCCLHTKTAEQHYCCLPVTDGSSRHPCHNSATLPAHMIAIQTGNTAVFIITGVKTGKPCTNIDECGYY